jgi:isoleucyl-tRNA synthetase
MLLFEPHMADTQKQETVQKSPAALREEETLKFWQEKNIFQKSLEKDSPKGEFIFFEGPPTANGRPGIHHVEARAFKDIIPRYKTMQGFHVRRKGGWDTHGLPVELEVEKKIGSKSKKDIEKYGIAAFNELCKESVWTYVDEWQKFTERMAYWVDLKDPYVTYDPKYMESLWSIVKTVNDKGLLYKDYRVVPWCARCGTALSSHELAQGYADVKDLSVYVKFELVDEPGTFVVAWTTTPWTLPGNVALAVGSKIEYSRLKITKGEFSGQTYIIAKGRVADVVKSSNILSKEGNFEEIAQVSYITGNDLIGKKYKPLYPFLKDKAPTSEQAKMDKAYQIYDADFVTTDDGTGVVHTAVMYGQDDFVLGTKLGLPKYHLVDDTGHFTTDTGSFAGKFVKDEETAVDVIKDLAHRGLLFKKEKYEHSYPHCWRCKTPLIYYARDSWYIRMSELRDKLIAENEKINWEPAYIKQGRFGEWLKEVKDWAFSRERYWGTPLPVWKCEDCQKLHVIGSVDELSEKSGGKLPKNNKGELDLHKPFIDEITLTCECGGVMKRVPEVIDVWFDSGAMPFAQDHYPFKNKDWVDGPGFPADYISEAIDQTRGWFYTLHAVGILMGKGAAYKNVISLGHLLDKNGKKMSKSLGNVVNPWDMMDKYGVDVLRFWMYSINQPGDSKNFDEKTVDEIVKKVPNLLLNVLSFYQMYAQEDVAASNTSKNVLDQWILALLAELSNNATKGLDTFNVLEPARAIREFIAELSQWYLRRSRDRFKSDDVEDKKNALATTRYVLQELSKLLAPFMPFLAEEIYQKVKGSDGKESVHLENWVEVKEVNQKVLEDMAEARKVVTLALEARAKANQKIRQPLQKLSIKSELLKGNTELLDVIRDEVNVKEVISDTSIENEVDLDTTITPELKLEGQARELLRALQDMRKKMGLNPQDQIALTLDTNDAGKEVFESFKNEIAKTAQITDVMFATLKEGFGEEVKVDDLTFKVQIVKK